MIFELSLEGLSGIIKGEGSSKEERLAGYTVWKWHNAFREVQAKSGCSEWLRTSQEESRRQTQGRESQTKEVELYPEGYGAGRGAGDQGGEAIRCVFRKDLSLPGRLGKMGTAGGWGPSWEASAIIWMSVWPE